MKPVFIEDWKCPFCGEEDDISCMDEENYCDSETLFMKCSRCTKEWKLNRRIEYTAVSIEVDGEEYDIK
jgi:hypothetical protein